MRAGLASGSDHRLGWNDKPPLTLLRADKHAIFHRIKILIETACRLKSAARAKQAGAARKNVQPAAQSLHHRQAQPPPPRQPSLEPRKTTATNRASMNAAQSRLNRRGVHQRIGIYKEKNGPVSLPGASVASGSNLPMAVPAGPLLPVAVAALAAPTGTPGAPSQAIRAQAARSVAGFPPSISGTI